ncbi:MAG: hypothetical protein A2W91_01835 [Bacteroidetes bacterium GWF2_38_335]|nr:MAG: hypothetical protein A2W91_01835 [Bacteroidetes bacterium GWF2_38_335]OFY78808.1 MAG: hypothetical protein A2281_19410 [Bacteroidetes bacterium RIFOXYA12_FULL_38_20]HBS85205.1 hypothetical protein [Bacteroidales bacterium]
MKNLNIIRLFFVISFISYNAYSQNIGDLKGIYYQAVAIDENGKEIVGMDVEGKPLYEKAIGVKFTITKGLNGDIQWEETHTTTTDKYGLFSLTIGLGEQTGNGLYSSMLEIPWIDADQFLKVEISTKNDGNFKVVSNMQFMSVPYSFYTDDIADNAITTAKILNEEILAEDIDTSAVTTSEILNETILAEDIATGSVESSEILNETILAEDIDTSAVTTSEILNETILAEDIGTGSVESSEILNETILAEDIDASAVTTSEILNETILAEDIGTGSVESSEILNETILAEDIDTSAVTTLEILNETILNEDIADSNIDLTSKVTGILPVENGGTGNSTFTDNGLLIGNGINQIESLGVAADGQIPIGVTGGSPVLSNITAGVGITVTNSPGGIQISSSVTEVSSDPAGTFVINSLPNGSTYTSNAINSFAVDFGDIVIGSIDTDLQGCMLTAYVSQPNVIRISIFNGTGGAVNLGTVNVRVLIVN